MHPRRLERLTELIQQTISRIILNLKDPGLGFVTITGAELTPDVSLAKIFYSVLGSPMEKQATMDALERAKPRIRHEVAQLENLRRVPEIIFIYDETPERADKVFRILNKLENERKNNGQPN